MKISRDTLLCIICVCVERSHLVVCCREKQRLKLILEPQLQVYREQRSQVKCSADCA
jgi:hypothetical protein